MKLKSIILLSAILSLGISFTSCQDDMETYESKLFLNSKSKVNTVLLKGEVETATGVLNASVPQPATEEITITYAGAPSLVGQYNLAYYDHAIALPTECFDIPEPTAVIKPKNMNATEVTVEFKNLSVLDKDLIYVLPVTMQSANMPILESARTTYFVFKGAALINTVANISENNVYPEWKNPDVVNNLTQLTVEALIYVDKFGKQISTLMGIEDNFLLRFGDAGLDDDQLQLATKRGNVTDPEWKVTPGAWTHVALTYNSSNGEVNVYFNGVKKGSTQTVNAGVVNWGVEHSDESNGKPRCFWIGYSYNNDRYLDGSISECRIWNRVLSAEEIGEKNHAYTVSSDADGLVVYWKFDEGEGTIIKDHTVNGNDAVSSKPLTWKAVELPQK